MLPQYFIYDEGKCNKQLSKHKKQEPRTYNKLLESSPNYLHTVASYDYYNPCPKYEECIQTQGNESVTKIFDTVTNKSNNTPQERVCDYTSYNMIFIVNNYTPEENFLP